jgi:hypothetical protein
MPSRYVAPFHAVTFSSKADTEGEQDLNSPISDNSFGRSTPQAAASELHQCLSAIPAILFSRGQKEQGGVDW